MALDDAYTTSLIHFEGANGSTVFLDENGVTWINSATPVISTAQYKFQTSSGLFVESEEDCLYRTAASDIANFTVGSDDFTLEMWLYPNGNSDAPIIFNTGGNFNNSDTPYILGLNSDRVPTFGASGASRVNAGGAASDALSTGAWHHIAGTRNGDNIYLFLDGYQVATAGLAGPIAAPAGMYIGKRYYLAVGYAFNGYIDEFRFSKGIARYTGATYAVPNAPFGIPVVGESLYFADGYSVY